MSNVQDNYLGTGDDEVFLEAVEEAYYTNDAVILGTTDLDEASEWQRATPAVAIALVAAGDAITAVIAGCEAYVGFLL